jgi:hypothetical protein
MREAVRPVALIL